MARPDSSGPAGDDTTGLPASAGGVRHVKLPVSDKGPLEEGQKFSPRYHIIKLLGIGGMGAVYQAWDAELSVAVALKVIRPEVSRDPVAAREIERRFKQELLLARQVTHKNVVRIFDLGEIDGIKYITMSYIQGTDLATTLRQSGRLPVSTVMPLARQIVEGLKAAHEAGVVHRDLKPANIMVEGDHAIVMDFGIARSTSQTGTAAAAASVLPPDAAAMALDEVMTQVASTVAGAVVGTVEYMAPEQARGEQVDQRADIYAFGLILYDLLVGRRRAEHAPSAIAELRKRMEEPPSPTRLLAPEIPEALDQFVSRCIDPDPAKRFQTTAELADALGRLDDHGEPLPIHRVFGMRVAVAALGLFMAILVGTWWFSRGPAPVVEHEPVSVVIADFQNRTADPAFDGTLEPMIKAALEGAGFINAYDRTQVRNLGLPAVSGRLDEAAARQMALSQGLGVVVSGSLDPRGASYQLSLKALEAVTGNTITSVDARASGRDQVLPVAVRLAGNVRTALGDETSESAQMFAMETLTATSLDVVREYARSMEALSNGRFEEAVQSASKAAEMDPKFGSAYGVMAAASRSLGRQQDAEMYIKQAVSHLDNVTERERYRIRGLFFLLTGDQQKCVEEYGALISRYSSDATARGNLALCSTQLRNMPKAIEEVRRAVAVLPKSARHRLNLSVYASYGGDFQTGEREAREVQQLNPEYAKGFVALAFAQLAQGRTVDAAETYRQLEVVNPSDAAAGLADLALYQGRLSEAARVLEKAAASDIDEGNPDKAAEKFAALAYTHLTRGVTGAALKAAESALSHSSSVKVRFLAARIFAEAGEANQARKLAASLASERQIEPQALAKIVEGDIALQGGNAADAIKTFTEANRVLDTWIGRFDLGRAYLEQGALLEADSEFDRCLKRRGEALALFLDEVPTYGYFPPVYYYLGRVRQGLKTSGFADFYRTYLEIRGQAGEDPRLSEIRRRAAL